MPELIPTGKVAAFFRISALAARSWETWVSRLNGEAHPNTRRTNSGGWRSALALLRAAPQPIRLFPARADAILANCSVGLTALRGMIMPDFADRG
jgi:hypothetical protein